MSAKVVRLTKENCKTIVHLIVGLNLLQYFFDYDGLYNLMFDRLIDPQFGGLDH